MKCVIPYKHFTGIELRYCLRGIEKYIEDPEVIIIGDRPFWLQNITHFDFRDDNELKFKERNVFQKLLLVNDDFIYFNDDHFLLRPYDYLYRYSGKLSERINGYKPTNDFRKTLQNTYDLFGDIDNYYRHEPMFIKRKWLDYLTKLDWNLPWGYCLKSIYCRVNNVEGINYPDLKIREPMTAEKIIPMLEGRPCLSTEEYAMNPGMMKVLNQLYPNKSSYEI